MALIWGTDIRWTEKNHECAACFRQADVECRFYDNRSIKVFLVYYCLPDALSLYRNLRDNKRIKPGKALT